MCRPLQNHILTALFLASSLLTACPAGPSDRETPESSVWPMVASVELKRGVFKPEVITIAAGGSITWRNRDDVRYSVTIEGLGVDHILDPGQTFTMTFEHPGDYRVTDRLSARGIVSSVRVK